MIFFRVTENTVRDHMGRATAAMPRFTHILTEHVMAYMSVFAPKGQTGQLEDSFYEIVKDAEEHHIESRVDYAEAVRSGTGIYNGNGPITPTNAGALKFFWPKVNAMTVWKGDLPPGPARARFVEWAVANGMMPFLVWPKGQPPQDYVTPALEIAEAQSPYYLTQALHQTGAK